MLRSAEVQKSCFGLTVGARSWHKKAVGPAVASATKGRQQMKKSGCWFTQLVAEGASRIPTNPWPEQAQANKS